MQKIARRSVAAKATVSAALLLATASGRNNTLRRAYQGIRGPYLRPRAGKRFRCPRLYAVRDTPSARKGR